MVKTNIATAAAHSDASKRWAVLRERVRPAFSTVNPAIAAGIKRISGRATRNGESGVTLAPGLWNVLARYKNESHNFNRYARQQESGLCRKTMKQADGRHCNDPSGQHEKEARKFQSATVNAKIA
jgi:hypothetical protein